MLTYRMTWMDVEKSKSMDVTVPTDAKGLTAQERNMSYTHRRQAAAQIKSRLQVIMDELNGVAAEEPHTAEEQAAAELSKFIKGQRYRDGKLLISYIDGTSHEGIQTMTTADEALWILLPPMRLPLRSSSPTRRTSPPQASLHSMRSVCPSLPPLCLHPLHMTTRMATTRSRRILL